MGLKQHLKLDKFDWCITIYYSVDSSKREEILKSLDELNCDRTTLGTITRNLDEAKYDTGFTYSNFEKRCSIVVIHKASSIGEFINTFEHEKNHLEMHICEALDINPYGETAAHMSGELAQLIFEKALCSIVAL